MELTSRYADNQGIRLHYKVAGEGDPVVLLHGFPEFWYSWRKQIPVLAAKYKVIVPDLRGYNESDKPKGWKQYLPSLITADVRAIIKAEGHSKVRIVAHDWGGVVGFEMGMFFPEETEQLVILNSPHPGVFGKHLRSNFRQKLRSWYMFFFQIPVLPDMLIRLSLPLFLWFSLKNWSVDKNAITREDMREYKKAFRKKGVITASLNYYRAAWKGRLFDQRDQKTLTKVPTLVLWGMNDAALGPELVDDFAPYFSGPFEVIKLQNCSHWVQSDQAERVNEELVRFFAN